MGLIMPREKIMSPDGKGGFEATCVIYPHMNKHPSQWKGVGDTFYYADMVLPDWFWIQVNAKLREETL